MRIIDMANLVAHQIAKDKIIVKVDIKGNKQGIYPQNVKIHLQTSKIRKLGWKAKIGVKEMYNRTISYMNESS